MKTKGLNKVWTLVNIDVSKPVHLLGQMDRSNECNMEAAAEIGCGIYGSHLVCLHNFSVHLKIL